jgi:hypothetical protein
MSPANNANMMDALGYQLSDQKVNKHSIALTTSRKEKWMSSTTSATMLDAPSDRVMDKKTDVLVIVSSILCLEK